MTKEAIYDMFISRIKTDIPSYIHVMLRQCCHSMEFYYPDADEDKAFNMVGLSLPIVYDNFKLKCRNALEVDKECISLNITLDDDGFYEELSITRTDLHTLLFGHATDWVHLIGSDNQRP